MVDILQPKDDVDERLAFPIAAGVGNLEEWRHGMSLRDYFAAAALTGLLAANAYMGRDAARRAY